MKKKTIAGLITVAVIAAVVMFAGCIEEAPSDVDDEYGVEYVDDEVEQVIVGNMKDQEVAGDIVKIVGNMNDITIINEDVSVIEVTGNMNDIYYPKEARPVIIDNGNMNDFITY
jgi:hypothetical protein